MNRKNRSRAAVVGGGPAGLMAAEVLAQGGAAVTVYDRMPSVGRKFLLAGRGGLNLTHGEAFEQFLSRYGRAEPNLRAAIGTFPPGALRAWAEALGQETFVGSSGRVFPRAMKASPLLRAWLARLGELGVAFRLRQQWTGWDGEGRLLFESAHRPVSEEADAVVLALGGASWPRLGSDGGWVAPLHAAGIEIAPLGPANCGFIASWSDMFSRRFAGQPLKAIALSFGGRTLRGEAIVTRNGLEGGVVYALSAPLRDAITATGETILHIDLRPDTPRAALERQLGTPRGKQSLSTWLRKAAKLSPPAIGLLHEAAVADGVRISELPSGKLAEFIKAVPVRLTATAPIAGAVSSAGGIAFSELDERFMLRKKPGVFVAGEMLDWEAPPGGHLLQASFATGAAAGRGALAWLRRD